MSNISVTEFEVNGRNYQLPPQPVVVICIDGCADEYLSVSMAQGRMPRTLEIDNNSLKKPCLMIDGGYPKNLDSKVAGGGIHVLKGGIVEFCRDIGWSMMEIAEMEKPQRQMFACFAEAMLLEFERCHTNFSWGRNNITLEKMDFIGAASVRHGFSTLNLNTNLQAAAA